MNGKEVLKSLGVDVRGLVECEIKGHWSTQHSNTWLYWVCGDTGEVEVNKSYIRMTKTIKRHNTLVRRRVYGRNWKRVDYSDVYVKYVTGGSISLNDKINIKSYYPIKFYGTKRVRL